MAKKIKLQDLQVVDLSGIQEAPQKYEIMLLLPSDINADQRQSMIAEFEETLK